MGIDPRIRERLAEQRGVAGIWQLKADGCTRGDIRHAASQMQLVHDGVLLSGDAPLTDWQRWKAATLTSPSTPLADWSGLSYLNLRGADGWPTTVKREGHGSSKRFAQREDTLGSLLVRYAQHVEADTLVIDDIPVLAPGRMILDRWAALGEKAARRMVRDALRTKLSTGVELQLIVARHAGRRNIVAFRESVQEYAELGLGRCRSDAEALAIALLAAAGSPVRHVNEVVAGFEADLIRPELRLIVELDGPQFHQFPTEDARKQAAWERAGWVVRRVPTDDVYDRPHLLLLAGCEVPTVEERAIAAATTGPGDVIARLRARPALAA